MDGISITIILVILTAYISYQAFNNRDMQQKLLFHPYTVQQDGQYTRFLTHGFVHANWQHLLINMFVLWQFGSISEQLFAQIFGTVLGPIAFVLFYLSAIVVATVPAFFRHQDNPAYASVGASGATSALVFIYIFIDPWQWFLFPPLPAILLGVAYLWYSSYMDRRGGDNIAHDAHFWGALYGLVFIIVSALAFKPVYFDFFFSRLLEGPSLPAF